MTYTETILRSEAPPPTLPVELPAGTPFHTVHHHPWDGWLPTLTRSYAALRLESDGVYRGGTGSAAQAVETKHIAWGVMRGDVRAEDLK